MNTTIENMITTTEPVDSLANVRKDNLGNIYLPVYRDPMSTEICNYMKVSIDKRSGTILSGRKHEGYMRLGVIENGSEAYICKTWGQAVSIFMNTYTPVVVATSWILKRKLKGYAKEHSLNLKIPTIMEEIGPRHNYTVPEKPSEEPSVEIPDSPIILKKPPTLQSGIIMGDALFRQIEPTRWLIRDFIPRHMKLGFIYAPSGIGKTFFALDMAFCIAAGRPAWHGFISHKANVLYVAGESATAINMRIIAHAITYGDEFKTNFAFYPFYRSFASTEDLKEFVIRLYNLKAKNNFIPDLIIFDTWNTFFTGDENDATAIAKFKAEILNRIMLLTGSTIIFCHHTTKLNEKDARGSSAIKGMADFMTLLSREKEPAIRATVTKNRLGKENQYVEMRIAEIDIDDWGYDEDGIKFQGGYLEYVGNSKIPAKLTPAAEEHLTNVKDAASFYGNRLSTGEWSISAESFRDYLINTLKEDATEVAKIFKLRESDFLPVLISAGYICIGKNEQNEIISITVIDDTTNLEITKNKQYLASLSTPSSAQ